MKTLLLILAAELVYVAWAPVSGIHWWVFG